VIPEHGEEASRENDSGSSISRPAWSSYTDDTPLSQDMSSLDLDGRDFSESGTEPRGQDEVACYGDLDGLDGEAKEALLCGIFPTLKPFDIKWTLKKYKGDVNQVIDELMTQSFLDENGGRYRGVEAFSEADLARPRKTKGKKRRNRQTEPFVSSPASEPPLQMSKWDTAAKDIEFISSRTDMPTKQVSSIYHKNGASLRSTISAIIEAHLALRLEIEDPIIQSRAIDLGHEFPSIPPSYLEALAQISHPSASHAHDLAEALAASHPGTKPTIDIEFRRPPLHLDHSSPIDSPPSPKKPPSTTTTTSTTHPSSRALSLETATALAAKNYHLRNTAFTQARAAYRKGKSDPLMGGAAAYYSQEARDADARAKAALSAAADKLVEQQSWPGGLDLHGVGVEDAKRIVRERVTAWWHELGLSDSARGGAGKGSSYRIVTGVGNHSERGIGKLGPAVGKMLIREGWKVEVGNGVLVVTGVARRK